MIFFKITGPDLCQVKKTKENKQYIKGTGARDLRIYLDISKPGPQFRFSLNKANPARSGGTAFKRVLRLRIQLRVPGPTAFKNFGATAFKNLPLLRLRIYKL